MFFADSLTNSFSLSLRQFSNFLAIVLDNLVDSNVFIRSAILSLEYFLDFENSHNFRDAESQICADSKEDDKKRDDADILGRRLKVMSIESDPVVVVTQPFLLKWRWLGLPRRTRQPSPSPSLALPHPSSFNHSCPLFPTYPHPPSSSSSSSSSHSVSSPAFSSHVFSSSSSSSSSSSPPSFNATVSDIFNTKMALFLSRTHSRLQIIHRLVHILCSRDINEENICCLNTTMLFFIFARRKGEMESLVRKLCAYDEVSCFQERKKWILSYFNSELLSFLFIDGESKRGKSALVDALPQPISR